MYNFHFVNVEEFVKTYNEYARENNVDKTISIEEACERVFEMASELPSEGNFAGAVRYPSGEKFDGVFWFAKDFGSGAESRAVNVIYVGCEKVTLVTDKCEGVYSESVKNKI